MKKVYVAGAISAKSTEQSIINIRKGILMGAELLSLGYSPYVPHLDYQFNLVQDLYKIDLETYYKHDLEWLKLCDCVLVLSGYEESKGVKAELEYAEKHGIKVYYSLISLASNGKINEFQNI